MRVRFLFISFLLSQVNAVFCQDAALKNYSVNQGLSQSTVNDLIRDNRGYLWISTGHGLNRYDGYQFKSFFSNSADSNSISENNVRNLLDDTIRNVLWVGTEMGLNKFDQHSGKFSQLMKGHPKLEKIYTSPIFYTADELWFFSGIHGVCIYHFDTKTAEIKVPFKVNRAVYYIREFSLLAFQKENNYLYLYSIAKGTTDSLLLPFEYPSHNIYNISYFADSRIQLLTEDGFYLVDKNAPKMEEHVPLPLLRHKNILATCTDHKNLRYYSVKDEGVFIFDKNGNLVKSFTEVMNEGTADEFSFGKVRQLLVDRSGNVWAGSDGSGLTRISLSNMHFGPVGIKMPGSQPGYFNEFVRSITELNGKLWTGTFSNGVFITKKTTGETRHVLAEQPDSGYQSVNTFNKVCATSIGIFTGTDRGLYLTDTTHYTFRKLNFGTGEEHRKVYDIFESKNFGILVATSSGLHRITQKENSYSLSVVIDSIYNISRIFEDDDGNIWLNYPRYGIKKLSPDGQVMEQTKIKGRYKTIGDITFSCFVQAGESIWASSGKGLWEFDLDINIVNHYDETDGLCNNFIYGILKDTLGNLWLSTNKGVSRFDLATRKFRNYGLEDGLRSLEHNTGAYFRNDNGDFYFGGIRGLNYFNPYTMKDNPLPPTIVLSRFNLQDNEFISPDTLIAEKKVFSFDYTQNTFSVEVAALDFTSPGKNEYAFYLENFDKDFYNSDTKRFARYSGLEPGVYTLWCKASNNDGVWSERQKLFTVIIAPPFWKTTWFRVLSVLAAIATLSLTIYLIVQQRYRKQLGELRRLQEIERIRLRISKDIHDEVGAGLTRIALMSEAAKIEHSANKEVGKKFNNVSETARKMTSGLHEIIWSVNPVYDNLESLLSYIRNYTYEFFEDTEINVAVTFPDHIPDIPVAPDMRRNLFLIVKEALNNSAKHACAKNVSLACSLEAKNFRFEISDNGKGFEMGGTGSAFSSGLKNMQRRAEELKLDFSISSQPDKGTVIRLSGNFMHVIFSDQ